MWRVDLAVVCSALALCCLLQHVAAIRVDNQTEFRSCNVDQTAILNEVEVRECRKWPCVARAGRSGNYQITFTQKIGQYSRNIRSDIYAWVRLPFASNRYQKPVRVPMPGERGKRLCPYTTPGCPIYPGVPTTISKSITIPTQARLAQGKVIVEFRITDDEGDLVTCFLAPVIVV